MVTTHRHDASLRVFATESGHPEVTNADNYRTRRGVAEWLRHRRGCNTYADASRQRVATRRGQARVLGAAVWIVGITAPSRTGGTRP